MIVKENDGKEPVFFKLHGFEAALDVAHNVVTLILYQDRLSSAPPVKIASMVSAEQAEEIAASLQQAANELRRQHAAQGPGRH